jgi:magnesium transporter
MQIGGLSDVRSALAASDTSKIWIDLAAPSQQTLADATEILGIHPLIAQDIRDRNERSKIVEIGDVLHIVLFALRYAGEADASEIDVVLGQRFLLTAHEPDWDPFDAPLLRGGVEPLLEHGPDKLLYALADSIVDGYFPVLDRLADEIDQLQDDVVERASQWTLHKLFVLKRELIQIRRATSPAREIFNQLTNRDLALIRRDHVIYFRDVYDHLIRVTDELDNYRELVSGTLDVYLSTVNNNLSLIMKRLTGVTVILAGIGAVAGIFGMSEAGAALKGAEAGGFWIVTAFTVTVAVAAAVILRRIDWI